jgi:hypothetical protein
MGDLIWREPRYLFAANRRKRVVTSRCALYELVVANCGMLER